MPEEARHGKLADKHQYISAGIKSLYLAIWDVPDAPPESIRATQLVVNGFGPSNALHPVCSEQAGCHANASLCHRKDNLRPMVTYGFCCPGTSKADQ